MVTKTSALELGRKGIRVNSINPGLIETEFLRSLDMNNMKDAIFQQYKEKSLLGRNGQPEDIANLTSFLASNDARNITGSIYVSDTGGLLKGN